MNNPLLTFDTTHHAMWAEEIAREALLGVEVVPAPSEAKAKCGLALRVLPEDLEQLLAALDRQGVQYAVFASE